MSKQLTTYEDIMSQPGRHRIVETETGARFEIQALPELELILSVAGEKVAEVTEIAPC